MVMITTCETLAESSDQEGGAILCAEYETVQCVALVNEEFRTWSIESQLNPLQFH